MRVAIRLRGLGKTFDRGVDAPGAFSAVSRVDLEVFEGEFFCLLGPTGCGKSTVLHLIAGFEPASEGEILIEGERVAGPGADRGVVFQSELALFSWLTVEENVGFGPRMLNVPLAERRELVERSLELVGLARHRAKFPRELSGGMKQRVQIARALVNRPRILLMDEPFGALDSQTRRRMQAELARIWAETRQTVVFVTHDIGEAIWLGDRIGVMTRGPAARIKQVERVDLVRPREAMTGDFAELFNRLSAAIHDESEAMLNE
jgi:NitT/TauT family transport system ATP-binding protein